MRIVRLPNSGGASVTPTSEFRTTTMLVLLVRESYKLQSRMTFIQSLMKICQLIQELLLMRG